MSDNGFLSVFVVLALADLYMSMVQRTTVLITRHGQFPAAIGGFLNPKFIRAAFPLTLIKWGWVAYWAYSGTTWYALLALFISWLLAVLLPVPAKLTLPAVFHQVSAVSSLDQEFGQQLLDAAKGWEAFGSRR